MKQKKLGIALGSGGTKAYSQIGFLIWLFEHKINYQIVAGTSAGASIGAFASIYENPYEIKKIYENLKNSDFLKYFKPSFGSQSFFSSDGAKLFLEEFFGGINIEDLKIKYSAIATDMNSLEEIVIKSGSLVEAIMASSAIPGLLPPIEKDGRFLMDGAITNPVPADICFKMGAEIVLGINVSKPIFAKRVESKLSKLKKSKTEEWLTKKIANPESKFLSFLEKYKNLKIKKISKRTATNLINDILPMLISQITKLKTEKLRNFLMISPDVSEFGTFQFSALEKLVEIGYNETEKNKEKIFELLEI
ncbi:MAG: patatin-like phospholipase family protein [Patescibacteria group bacterium]